MHDATRPSTTQRTSFMRVHIRRTLGAGGPLPTPAEVVAAIGGSVPLAFQVLCEFPQFARSADSPRPAMRRTTSTR
jgi:hypothetical protein